MNIAIIGTGNVGTALGQSLTRAGHSVVYAGRDQQKTERVSGEVSATPAQSPADAARDADIVVIAVPYATAGEQVAREIVDAVSGKVVIDATNPLSEDYSRLVTDGKPSGAEHFAQWLPGAKVVKAFNTLFASVQADPGTHGVTIDALYATDDEGARRTVDELLRSMGFRPVFVGPLARAKELEAIAWLNIRLQLEAGGNWQTAIGLIAPPENATGIAA